MQDASTYLKDSTKSRIVVQLKNQCCHSNELKIKSLKDEIIMSVYFLCQKTNMNISDQLALRDASLNSINRNEVIRVYQTFQPLKNAFHGQLNSTFCGIKKV